MVLLDILDLLSTYLCLSLNKGIEVNPLLPADMEGRKAWAYAIGMKVVIIVLIGALCLNVITPFMEGTMIFIVGFRLCAVYGNFSAYYKMKKEE
jgi:hypothetical protein